jgi:hypothetical protein
MHDIEVCRTAALGGHIAECDQCGHQEQSYNSCGNRHCPKCLSLARARWLDNHCAQLLPTPYFHVVFTVPQPVAQIALQNKRVVYGILCQCASQTLLRIAADPKHLGAKIGFLAVLHTWGQNLHHHPHLHCVVPGGGLSPDGRRWLPCRAGFFLPVKVLARLFRGLFLHCLEKAFDAGKLEFHGSLERLRNRDAFKRFLKPCRTTKWVVYSKPPFGGPAQVLDYLGRYTHRVAISNDRLLDLNNGKVTFRWKDYRQGNAVKAMTLTAEEFIRRFLLHVLPKGLVRIRHFGFLANCHREAKLALCRELLGAPDHPEPAEVSPDSLAASPANSCPACGVGHMIQVLVIPRPPIRTLSPPPIDSS